MKPVIYYNFNKNGDYFISYKHSTGTSPSECTDFVTVAETTSIIHTRCANEKVDYFESPHPLMVTFSSSQCCRTSCGQTVFLPSHSLGREMFAQRRNHIWYESFYWFCFRIAIIIITTMIHSIIMY